MDPYRSPTTSGAELPAKPKRSQRDLLVVFAIVWVVAVVRVALGLWHHQTFGAELTLAALAILVIPPLLRG